MISTIACACVAGGAVLAARPLCTLSRFTGAALLAVGSLGLAAPAHADETLLAADNAEVACTISRDGLTRISLKDDRFASVSKLSATSEAEDFSVVNEPTRGDIYISVPEGFAKPVIAFFGTSAKGFVYKFACRVAGQGALQVFVENRQLLAEAPAELARAASPQETGAALVQAMYAGRALDGFDIRQPLMEPVMVGSLKVQLVTEYHGLALKGHVLRIENTGREAVTLDEQVIAPSSAIAVSVAEPNLAPKAVTTAFIVAPTGAQPGE